MSQKKQNKRRRSNLKRRRKYKQKGNGFSTAYHAGELKKLGKIIYDMQPKGRKKALDNLGSALKLTKKLGGKVLKSLFVK